MKLFGNAITQLVMLITLASFLRLFWLDKIPAGISNDELYYTLSAKAVWINFSDITGKWNPLSLTTIPGETPMGELPALLLAPLIGSQDFSLFNARAPFAILGVLLVVLVYCISSRIFDRQTAFYSGLIMAFNPLAIFNSRTGYDIPFTVFFFLLGLYLLISRRHLFNLLSIVPLFIAFYSYVGLKIIFIPFVFLAAIFSYFLNNRQNLKQLAFVVMFSLIIFLNFIFQLRSNPIVGRIGEILNPMSQAIISKVDTERRLTLENTLSPIISNRYTVFISEGIKKYFGAFSSEVLFTSGDKSNIFFVWEHGFLYYPDILFLLIGIVVLFQLPKYKKILFFGLLVLSPLPSVFASGLSYSMRSYLFYCLLVIILGIGAKSLLAKATILKVGYLFIYMMFMVNFFVIYFFRNPVSNSNQFLISQRVLARYIKEESKYKNVVILDTDPKASYKQFIFYNNYYTKQSANTIKNSIISGNYLIANVSFLGTSNCPKTIVKDTVYIVSPLSNCAFYDIKNVTSIADIADSGDVYKIYNESFCSQYGLKRFISSLTINDLDIENLTQKTFCENFVIQK